jgi:hypothetical protein
LVSLLLSDDGEKNVMLLKKGRGLHLPSIIAAKTPLSEDLPSLGVLLSVPELRESFDRRRIAILHFVSPTERGLVSSLAGIATYVPPAAASRCISYCQ